MATPVVRILITAGPTHEPIDAVRYLANRSSGRLGLALAEAATAAGCVSTLLLGPTPADPPAGITVHRFESTADLQRLIGEHWPHHDVLIMAAAVADYRRPHGGTGKLPRRGAGLTLELEATPDLVAEAARAKRPDQAVIGFALEDPATLADRARRKLTQKHLDAIVANPLRTMGAGDIDATIFSPDAAPVQPGAMSKPDFARWLVQWIVSRRGG